MENGLSTDAGSQDLLRAMWMIFPMRDLVLFRSLPIREKWHMMRRIMRDRRHEASRMEWDMQGVQIFFETEELVHLISSAWPHPDDKKKAENLLRALLAYPSTWTENTPPINPQEYRSKEKRFPRHADQLQGDVANRYQAWISEHDADFFEMLKKDKLSHETPERIFEPVYPPSTGYLVDKEFCIGTKHHGLNFKMRIIWDADAKAFVLKYMIAPSSLMLVPAHAYDPDEENPPLIVLYSYSLENVDLETKYFSQRSYFPAACFIPKEIAFEAIREFCNNPREAPRSADWTVIDEFKKPILGIKRHPRSEEESDAITHEAMVAIRPHLADKIRQAALTVAC